jgi:hypothetical protein
MSNELVSGEVWAWRDGGSVQLKAIAPSGDPIDLSGDEARRIGARLIELADAADAD